MSRVVWSVVVCLVVVPPAAAQVPLPEPLVRGVMNASAVAVGTDGRVYLAILGFKKGADDGKIVVLKDGKAEPFATGLMKPRGMVAWQQWLYLTDERGIVRVDRKGKVEVIAALDRFPTPPATLAGLAVDEQGTLYAVAAGDLKDNSPAIFRIPQKGKIATVTDPQRFAGLKRPKGLVMDGIGHVLVADVETGELHRVRIKDGSAQKIADGLGRAGNLGWDHFGRLYVVADADQAESGKARVFVIGRPGQKPVVLAEGLHGPNGLCYDPTAKKLLVSDTYKGTVTALPATVPGAEVDETPLPLESEVAFPKLKWTGWQGVTDAGKVNPLRPLVLTHAGDGSNRVFVATQHGVIHVFRNDPNADKTQVFLDIQDRVLYQDNENEQGFLGFAFHPNYRKNGEFFAFYSKKKDKLTNVLSRFRVSKDDPNKADPDSEEVLLTVKRPFWNHDGGTICFGPDGYLYLALGDGGAGGDPFNHAQNLKSMLGKIHRLDVDRKDEGKAYAVPKDNPFVGKKDALPETWAYGLRNVWRMAFDRKTGRLWAADVGQNLYEEINLIKKGGNYGWKPREGLHPYDRDGVDVRPDLIEPIWEYHHDLGKSITGGTVYRGSRLPELDGAYLYADYITGKIWALWYDEGKGRVVANRPIRDRNLPIMSFGEDEQGDVYYLTYSASGQGIFRFVRSAKK
jgi:glucose/arabinose dehydrogenase